MSICLNYRCMFIIPLYAVKNSKYQILTKRLFNISFNSINKMNSLSKHVEISEGSARMLYDESEAVFYNKVQVLNRDISTQVIRLFVEKFTEERSQRYLHKRENAKKCILIKIQYERKQLFCLCIRQHPRTISSQKWNFCIGWISRYWASFY